MAFFSGVCAVDVDKEGVDVPTFSFALGFPSALSARCSAGNDAATFSPSIERSVPYFFLFLSSWKWSSYLYVDIEITDSHL